MAIFRFSKVDGKIKDKEILWSVVKKIMNSLPDNEYVWEYPKKNRFTRSKQQNAYYWGVVCRLIAEHSGHSDDEIHQILSHEFLRYEKNGIEFVRSTTDLDTASFEQYMEQCRRWASIEASVYIPLPNEPENYYYNHTVKK